MNASRCVGGLAVAEAGAPDGRPILFLHGIGSSSTAFAGQLAHFGQHRWCIAPDAPGYAGSADDPTVVGLDAYVARYVGLLDELEAERADVVGVSWGGVIAARLAADQPDRVRRLVLVDTSRGSGITAEKAAAMRGRISTFEAEGPEPFSQGRSPRLLSPAAPPELIANVAATMAASIRLPGYRQAAESMATTDNAATLRAITVPTLVVVGTDDVVCPPEEAETIAGLVPGAALQLIEDAGHLSNQEQPEAFNRAVADFLDPWS